MKIFFCGQKSFGAAVLDELMKRGHEIVGVAPPPQDGKRKDKVEILARKKELPLISDCDRLSYRDIPEDTDLIVAAHSHWMISERACGVAKYGGIGFHPSLLPRHRGRDAVRWAVHMGDAVTGGTVYWLNDKTDGGEIYSQRIVFIAPGEDYHSLWERIFQIGVKQLCDAVDGIEKGRIIKVKQDERFATFEPSFERRLLKRNDLFQLCSTANDGEGVEVDYDGNVLS